MTRYWLTFGLILTLVVGWYIMSGKSRGESVASVGERHPVETVDQTSPERDDSMPEIGDRDPLPPLPSTPDLEAVESEEELDPAPPTSAALEFTTAIEATLMDRLDLDSLLDLASEIASLEVDARANPEPHPTGRIEFPIPNTPDGVTAFLAVDHARKAEFEGILTLSLTTERSGEPYLLEGCVRDAPSVELKVWHGEDGELLHLTILTSVKPNRATQDYGLSMFDGEVTEGLHFHMEASAPSGWTAVPYGFRDGAPVRFDRQVNTDQDPTTRLTAFRAFGNQLLKLRKSLDR